MQRLSNAAASPGGNGPTAKLISLSSKPRDSTKVNRSEGKYAATHACERGAKSVGSPMDAKNGLSSARTAPRKIEVGPRKMEGKRITTDA